ncbi:MAG: tRNA-dihydrouridine synthase family protein, partial [Clostridiales bacterium]|nr:tRNA-dihydrouridine synthase family protein [Clostridiales bacterium]
MQLSHLTITNPIFAAPLAGFSTRAFREILHDCGAGLAYGEMVSAQALCYGNKRTKELLDMEGELGLHVVQLFGSDPAYIREAACIARELGADIIDINMGCPMPKVVNNGEGAALLRNPRLAASLVEAAKFSG